MKICLTLSATFLALLAGGCGNNSQDSVSVLEKPAILTAETLGEQVVLNTADWLADARFAAADRANGERQAQICRACHSLDAGGPNMIGPGLHGFFGRGVGKAKGFAYSQVLQESDFVWTPRALDAWLAQPGRFLPGNSMPFAGVMNADDRNDMIAYLLEKTSSDNEQ